MSEISNVITISYGRQLFDPMNPEHVRHVAIAQEFSSLDMVVFTLKREGLKTLHAGSGLVIHPTNSRNRLCMPFDAFRIAARILKKQQTRPVITTQDPAAAGLVGWFLKRRFGVALVVQEHCDVFSTEYWRRENLKNQIEWLIGRFVLRRADVVRVVADRSIEAVRKLGVTASITKLSVPIEPSQFLNARAARPHQRDTFECVTVARFVKQKNLTMMIRAFAAAYHKNSRLRLTLIGRGPEEAVYRAEIAKQFPPGTDTPITIKSWTDDVSAVMRTADAYLLTSNYEGWGRVLIEAMVAELPIITTDVGCVGEVITPNVHALVTPLDDSEAFAEAILRLASDKALYEKMVAAYKVITIDELPGTDTANYPQQWRDSLTVR